MQALTPADDAVPCVRRWFWIVGKGRDKTGKRIKVGQDATHWDLISTGMLHGVDATNKTATKVGKDRPYSRAVRHWISWLVENYLCA